MAWSGGDVPAERAVAAVSELAEARDGVKKLKSFLLQLGDRRAPWAELEADGVLDRLSNVASALDVAGAAAGGQNPAVPSDGARPQPSGSSSRNTRKRSFSRRSYFRCTHKTDQGCNAKRHIQVCAADPSKHVVTYYGEHTCRDPSKIPLVIQAAAPDGGTSNLISFAPSSRSTGAASSSQAVVAMDGSAPQLSTSWCTSDNVFSSSPGSFMQMDELGAVVGSAAGAGGVMSTRTLAAGSAPDNGGTMMPGPGGGGAGSFPSSPNSLGFEVGDDDDFFRLDP